MEHGSREDCLAAVNLDADGILEQIVARMQSEGLSGPVKPNLVRGNA